MKHPSLKAKLTAYLSIREALGLPIQNKLILHDFVNYLGDRNYTRPILAQVVLDWVCSGPRVRGVSTQYARLVAARGFLVHVKASLPETEIPNINLIAKPRRPRPFVFSIAEIRRFLRVTARVETDSHWSICPQTAQTLFALMICTGLRPGEAMSLTTSDLHLDAAPPHILVRNAKFHKSRLVPLHASAVERLRKYLKQRKRLKLANAADALFISRRGERVTYQPLRRLFLRVIESARMSHQPGQLPPSLHALRHTFCVNRLRSWYEAGLDARALLPALSVYLGHADLSATYWYLSSTPDLMGAASQRFQSYTERRGEV